MLYATQISLSMSCQSHALFRSPHLYGRRLHERKVSPMHLWLFIYDERTLELVDVRDLQYMYFNLQNYGLCISNWYSQSGNQGLELDMFDDDYLSSCPSNDVKHRYLPTPSHRIPYRKAYIAVYQSDPIFMLWDSKQSFSDYNIIVTRILAALLLWIVHLAPLLTKASIPFSTSICLMTMTNLSSFQAFEDDLSVHHDLTGTIGLSSLWFIALLELQSMKLIFYFVALGNAVFYIVVNLGILLPSFVLVASSYE